MKKEKFNLITTHSGKLAGIPSISTSSLFNVNCKKRACLQGAICSKCYSNFYQSIRIGLRKKLEKNTELLINRLLTNKEIDNLDIYTLFFRFESFGDLINVIQFENYCNIAKYFRQTTFAIWTKNPHIISEYVKKGGKIPKNLVIGLSSIFINEKMNDNIVAFYEKYFHIDFVFTVYDKQYIKDNNININCGAKKCAKCQNCYKHHKETVYINEKLK